MGSREFRIKVRGEFKDLTDEQRSGLLADASEHDMLSSAFTREGHLAYDVAARPFFTFRFADTGETDDDLVAATERAVSAAGAWLDARGLSYKLKDPVADDLSQAPMSKRQRRAQHGG